ncbi:hypothetical protein J1605_011597 [Eschrichtius robustus]|uniref:Uncharacterized protein n=1 Tax=Eschrichtius robustus TaxID=9764 RepID=A0AB34GJY6_ESCRO|nr:hypothetical protein J1605_011597 [Eschrichtius robustus]
MVTKSLRPPGQRDLSQIRKGICPVPLQPYRRKVDQLDVDSLFSNIESVRQISAKLLSLLEEATTDVEPAMQVIGSQKEKSLAGMQSFRVHKSPARTRPLEGDRSAP